MVITGYRLVKTLDVEIVENPEQTHKRSLVNLSTSFRWTDKVVEKTCTFGLNNNTVGSEMEPLNVDKLV